ncbi:TATA [Symbiodinium sp. CCMP2592]|nr:TATA [Symbiodinium sp. CCMP2592]
MVMRIRRPVPLLAGLLILALLSATTSFAVGRFGRLQTSTPGKTAQAPLTGAPPTLPRPERTVTTRHLFGLGTSELLVILGAAILFFGPETLKGLAKEAGKAAGDLKEVPKAFEEGMSETDKTKPGDEEAQEPKKTELKKEEKPES